MTNYRLASAIQKLAQKLLDAKAPTDLEKEVASEIQKIRDPEGLMKVRNNLVTYAKEFEDGHYWIRITVKELWNHEVFAFYEIGRADLRNAWTETFDTNSYKGNPKNIARSILAEIKKDYKNIIKNTLETGFSNRSLSLLS